MCGWWNSILFLKLRNKTHIKKDAARNKKKTWKGVKNKQKEWNVWCDMQNVKQNK